MEPNLTTLEVIRTAWPIVAALVGIILWLAGVAFMARQTKEDFREFKSREYADDKKAILDAIRDVKTSQERSEEKLEEKLDRMAADNNSQLNKVHEQMNQTNILLARMEGKLSNISTGPKDNSVNQ